MVYFVQCSNCFAVAALALISSVSDVDGKGCIMRNIADTIRRLNARHGLANQVGTNRNTRLGMVSDFGSNPGNLLAWKYIPKVLPTGAPLVVVLHGCTQTAADYDNGSGWSELAEKYGFALLFPEQQRANSPNLCFNWFSAGDTTRGDGEVLSISQMVAALTNKHSLDQAKIFITGLSAGGAMAAAMLATYPELFKGGAIIAGLPYGTASSVPEAFDRMRGHGLQESGILADRVRHASDYRGPWPSVSVWHGTADQTVDPINMEAIIAQWHCVHDIDETPATGTMNGHRVRRWSNAEGVTVIEAYAIKGMGHGTPIRNSGLYARGSARPFMLDVGISSTWHIANSWGLIGKERVTMVTEPALSPSQKSSGQKNTNRTVGNVIEDALRAAGLMK